MRLRLGLRLRLRLRLSLRLSMGLCLLLLEVLMMLVHVVAKSASLGALMGMTALQLLLRELGAKETVHRDNIGFGSMRNA